MLSYTYLSEQQLLLHTAADEAEKPSRWFTALRQLPTYSLGALRMMNPSVMLQSLTSAHGPVSASYSTLPNQ